MQRPCGAMPDLICVALLCLVPVAPTRASTPTEGAVANPTAQQLIDRIVADIPAPR